MTNPLFTFPYVIQGDGSVGGAYAAAPSLDPGSVPDLAALAGDDPQLGDLLQSLPADLAVGFTTTGAFGEFGGTLGYAQAGSTAASIASGLLLAGSGLPINGVERAFDAATGAPLPGFPAVYQGLDFLGAPLFADVTGDGEAEILEGSDSNTVHAYTADGSQAPGWPKFHTGWNLFSPATGDLDGDGDVEVVVTTREGWLYAWETPGTAAGNDQWWSIKHDEWNTGRYGTDTRPPGVARDLDFAPGNTTASFVAPGDDWYAGDAEGIEVRFDTPADAPTAGDPDLIVTAAAGETVTVEVPRGTRRVTVAAVDDAGLRGRPVAAGAGATPAPASPPPRLRPRRAPRRCRPPVAAWAWRRCWPWPGRPGRGGAGHAPPRRLAADRRRRRPGMRTRT